MSEEVKARKGPSPWLWLLLYAMFLLCLIGMAERHWQKEESKWDSLRVSLYTDTMAKAERKHEEP